MCQRGHPRARLTLHGPADIELSSRPTTLRLGLLGQSWDIGELQEWLERCVDGIPGRDDTKLTTLFPAFPGTGEDSTFRVDLQFSDEAPQGIPPRHSRFLVLERGHRLPALKARVADDNRSFLCAATLQKSRQGTPQATRRARTRPAGRVAEHAPVEPAHASQVRASTLVRWLPHGVIQSIS